MSNEIPAYVKAHTTGRWAETMFRALSRRVAERWEFVSFRGKGKGKGEWRGVVDIVAIRKDTSQPENAKLKRGDLFEIILVQVKGGTARPPTKEDCIRLREVARRYAARVVLFEWKKGVSWRFLVLDHRSLRWIPTPGKVVFA
jgi:hypothetical protein